MNNLLAKEPILKYEEFAKIDTIYLVYLIFTKYFVRMN